MLYVFHVDTGTMMTFDLVAFQTVETLKQFVEKESRIPADKQVLLISGGECLDPSANVCSYAAGTDTNPIFLFSKCIIESTVPPSPSVDFDSETDIKEKVRETLDLPANYQSVVKRTSLAQQLHDLAQHQTKICEQLVHDQHLQQQGWAAVVANLEDITSEFRKRAEIFEKGYLDYKAERTSYLAFLDNFRDDLVTLQKIPILDSLLESERLAYAELESSKNSENTESTRSEPKELSLFQWISASDSSNSMDQLYDHCSRGLKQFDDGIFNSLKSEVDEMLKNADNPQMKEVKGLSDRLSGLETLMREAKKYVQEQADSAQSLLKNQTRCTNVKDASVFPDLCMSHKKQLQHMAANHQRLCDIRRRCSKAKEELSLNLYHRLKWVMFVENHIVELDQKLVIFHENLKRLRKHLEVLQQIHMAPATYLSAVTEVVRRRKFSQAFLLWASEVACHLLIIHNEEVTRRKEFLAQFENHFLVSLFPGMEDMPPPFATEAPSIFDSSLPKITEEDLERLKKELPDLADKLNLPDLSNLNNFFNIKALERTDIDKVDEKAVEEKIVEVVGSNLEKGLTTAHGLPHLKDLDRGCESETDTEEFEKVGQSPLELHFEKEDPARPGMQDASTCTEDNLQISRSEHDKLKGYLWKMSSLAKQATNELRSELEELKKRIMDGKASMEKHEGLTESLEKMIIDREEKQKEILRVIKEGHEVEVNGLKEIQDKLEKELVLLKAEKHDLKLKLEEVEKEKVEIKERIEKIEVENLEQIGVLEKQLKEKEADKEKCLKELADRLSKEYKAEIESIRSRFKLMTMERSPSDSSLEKIGDFASIPNRETILLQMTENFELDKEKAIKEALEEERKKWELKLKELEDNAEIEKQNYASSYAQVAVEEKERQIDRLQEMQKNLSLESVKQKDTICQLVENECRLREQLTSLEASVHELQGKLEETKKHVPEAMVGSVAILDDKSEKSEGKGSKTITLSLDCCKPGDKVLVFWDPNHENFRILQENNHMFFLHTDSIERLNLEIVDKKPNKLYCYGIVLDKQFCCARKAENRYKIAMGSKFYRVKVKPYIITRRPRTGHSLSIDLTQSLDEIPEGSGTGTATSPLEKVVLKSDDMTESEIVVTDNPEEVRPASIEKNFGDSGIVENVEQATAAIDESVTDKSIWSSDPSDIQLVQQSVVGRNWFEMMFSRVFSKSDSE